MKHSALRRYVSASLGALLGAGFFLVPSVPFAATLTVNTLDDSWNGGCDVTHCSLLEAIADAGSSDTINFDFSALILPIGGPVITLAVGLPPIVADHLTIDGYDCTGCGGVSENTADPVNGLNMQIGPTIDGAGVVAFWPLLSVAAHDVTLRGLNLINSGSDAIYVTGGDVDELQVEGCIIGLARDGVTPAGNAGAGIYLDRGDDPVIGPYNVISGNSGAGIEIAGNYPDDGVIFGNLIGTDITATVGVGNGGHGISATATSVSSGQSAQRDWAIGSVLPAEQNVISGNGGHGIYMERRVWNFDVVGNVIGLSGDQIFPIGNGGDGVRMIGASGSTNFPKDSSFEDNVISGNGGSGLYCHACRDQDVYRNSIGTNEWGDPGLGNTEAGIYIYGSNYHNSEDWLIGSSSPADSNDIAYNGGDGIRLRRGTGSKQSRRHTIGINQFYSNGGLAIDLEGATTGDGPSVPTATSCSNDNSLGNRGAARPVIDSVGIQAGILEVSGTSCNSATVYLFVAEPDPSGYGEPTIYLDTVQANSAGLWSYSQPAAGLGSGTFITAYSEDGDGETGEAAANVEILGCDDDSDGFDSLNCGGPDCDDNDAGINPAAPEACDGIDTNCDGLLGVDEIDIDGDGQSVCAGDCDSTDITIYLGAPELCDGLDNDCDGLLSAGEVDSDGDGYMVCDGDCADADGAVFPGAAEVCDGVDTNCDGALGSGEVDSDGDGFLLCDGDCDDTSTSSYPGAPELCDGLDNDCDGVVPGDELDGDGDGLAVCAGDCDDTDSGVYLGAAELCDGLDNDCDGSLLADEVDADGDGVLVCAGDCNDAAAAIYPGAPEVCDGLDNDCDGVLGATEVDADGDGVSTTTATAL
jgi:hypothetical protein